MEELLFCGTNSVFGRNTSPKVGDIVENGIVNLVVRFASHCSQNIDVDIAIAEVAERFLSMATHPMRLETDSALLRPVDVPELRGDPSRLQTATGWVPTHDLDDTLGEVLDDWRGRLDGHPTAD